MTTLDTAVRSGPTVSARAEVRLAGDVIARPLVVSGQVTYDLDRARLRDCSVTLIPEDGVLPSTPTDPLAPQVQHMHLFRAVSFGDTVVEEPVGAYVMDSVDLDRSAGTVQVTGYDSSLLIADARWEAPYEVAEDTPVVEAIVAAVASRAPWLDLAAANVVDVDEVTPHILWGEEVTNDPWADIADLATGAGLWVRFDRAGRLTVGPVPDVDEVEPGWHYRVGEDATLTGLGRTLTGRPYNVVIARGEPETGTPVEAIAEDTAPGSPSHVDRYRRPYWLVSPFIRTEAQAGKAARAQLRKELGTGDDVRIDAVPHPGREVWDVVTAYDPRLGLDARCILDRVALPLGAGTMTLDTRRRTL